MNKGQSTMMTLIGGPKNRLVNMRFCQDETRDYFRISPESEKIFLAFRLDSEI